MFAVSVCWATPIWQCHLDWAGRLAAPHCFSGWRGGGPCHCVSSLSLSGPDPASPADTTSTCCLSSSSSYWPTPSTWSSGSGWSPSVYSPHRSGRYSEDTSSTSYCLQATTELPLLTAYCLALSQASLLSHSLTLVTNKQQTEIISCENLIFSVLTELKSCLLPNTNFSESPGPTGPRVSQSD